MSVKKVLAVFIVASACLVSTLTPIWASEGLHPLQMTFTTFPSKGVGELYERILTEAYGRLGYSIVIERVPGQRALVMADSGVVDGEAARLTVIESSNRHLVRVPTSIFNSEMMAFTKYGDMDVSQGWESLGPYKIGVLRGYKYVELKTKYMNRVLAPTYEKLVEMLAADRVDVIVLSLFDGLKALQDAKLSVPTLQPPLATLPLYHYLNKKHEKMVPQVDRVLREMKVEGRLQEIAEELERELRRR